MTFLLILIGLAVTIFVVTGGFFPPGYEVAFFVLVALVTGTLFWWFTGSTQSQYTDKIGMRLAGGAATGAIFMLLAHQLLPATPPSPIVIISPSPPKDTDAVLTDGNWSNSINRVSEWGSGRYVVEFHEAGSNGKFWLTFLKDGKPFRWVVPVARVGSAQAAYEEEDSK